MFRILIADDHTIVRQGLKQILASEPGLQVAGEAATAAQTLALVRAQSWDIVVLDLTMPGRSGLEILQDMRREYPRLPVLVLSMHAEELYALRVLKAGAAGYITKDSAARELVQAIRRVLAGGRYISSTLAEKLAYNLSEEDGRLPHERLSNREYHVFCLIAAGKPLKNIADELALSEKTISTYRARVLEKMDLQNNAELIRYALHHKLVE